MSAKMTFVSWAAQVRRSEGVARALGAKAFYVEIWKGCALPLLPVRYLLQAVKTWRILRRERPDVVLTMNPPPFLPLVAYLYSRLHGARFVIDSHTGALVGRRWARLLFLHRFLSRRAVTTIVTNMALAEQVKSWGAHTTVLPDRLPEWTPAPRTGNSGPARICFICSFSDDEPVPEVLGAARSLPEYRFVVTGNPGKKARGWVDNRPDNVTFTGFVPDSDYLRLLSEVDVIMVLVTRDHTLLCGAYEAVALEKPLVTSCWRALSDYFTRGTVYVDNTPDGIRQGIVAAVRDRDRLGAEMRTLKQELKPQWDRSAHELTDLLKRGYDACLAARADGSE
jgi:glycosyltransferase involved in cell wall biosynthesis